jgi:hypothetical protein
LRNFRKKIIIGPLMFTRSIFTAVVLLGLASFGRADGLAIKGAVKGTDGKPLAGAEVKAERLDHHKDHTASATTNAKGEYEIRGLALAPYKVTAIVNKVP